MANVIEKTGSTIDEAIQAALDELGVTRNDVDIEILETPTKKIFGLFGGTPAKVRVTVKEISTPAPTVDDVALTSPAADEKISADEVAEPAPVVEEKISDAPDVSDEKISEADNVEENIEPILEPSPVDEDYERNEALKRAQIFLYDVFDAMNLKIEIDIEILDDGGFLFNLSGKGLGILIGRHGQALDSLQYLLNLAANRRDAEEKFHFTLDVEGYRDRRAEALEKLAKNTAERAIKTRRDVRLEPMNRHERKVIHTTLQDNDRVETHSAGSEPYRYVIVSPKRGGKR